MKYTISEKVRNICLDLLKKVSIPGLNYEQISVFVKELENAPKIPEPDDKPEPESKK